MAVNLSPFTGTSASGSGTASLQSPTVALLSCGVAGNAGSAIATTDPAVNGNIFSIVGTYIVGSNPQVPSSLVASALGTNIFNLRFDNPTKNIFFDYLGTGGATTASFGTYTANGTYSLGANINLINNSSIVSVSGSGATGAQTLQLFSTVNSVDTIALSNGSQGGSTTMIGSAKLAITLPQTPSQPSVVWPEISPYTASDVILSEYANSPIITALVAAFAAAADPSVVLNDWFNKVWNVTTAQGYGLDVWGRIVGVNRVLKNASQVNLGFTSSVSGTTVVASGDSLNVAPFYNGGQLTTNYYMTDDAFRVVILTKAMSNIWNGTIQGMNALINFLVLGLSSITGVYGDCYVVEAPMAINIYFNLAGAMPMLLFNVVTQSGVIPRPSGCSLAFNWN